MNPDTAVLLAEFEQRTDEAIVMFNTLKGLSAAGLHSEANSLLARLAGNLANEGPRDAAITAIQADLAAAYQPLGIVDNADAAEACKRWTAATKLWGEMQEAIILAFGKAGQ
jgi:hypothetical protein